MKQPPHTDLSIPALGAGLGNLSLETPTLLAAKPPKIGMERLRSALYLLEDAHHEELRTVALGLVHESGLQVVCRNRRDSLGVVYFEPPSNRQGRLDDVFFTAFLTESEAARGLSRIESRTGLKIVEFTGEILSQIGSACEYACGLRIHYEWNGEYKCAEFSPREFSRPVNGKIIDKIVDEFLKLKLGAFPELPPSVGMISRAYFMGQQEILAVTLGASQESGSAVLVALQEQNQRVDSAVYLQFLNHLASQGAKIHNPKLVIVSKGPSAFKEFEQAASHTGGLIYSHSVFQRK